MKIALLGTGFGQAHAAVYAQRPDVDEVVVFGRTPQKLATISEQFGFGTTTDLDALITDDSVDLIDICLPTRLHADVAARAMQAGRDVLIELPLAATLDDARRVIEVQQATGRRAFVDMFSRFTLACQQLRDAVADRRYGPLQVLVHRPGSGLPHRARRQSHRPRQRPRRARTHPRHSPAPHPARELAEIARQGKGCLTILADHVPRSTLVSAQLRQQTRVVGLVSCASRLLGSPASRPVTAG